MVLFRITQTSAVNVALLLVIVVMVQTSVTTFDHITTIVEVAAEMEIVLTPNVVSKDIVLTILKLVMLLGEILLLGVPDTTSFTTELRLQM